MAKRKSSKPSPKTGAPDGADTLIGGAVDPAGDGIVAEIAADAAPGSERQPHTARLAR